MNPNSVKIMTDGGSGNLTEVFLDKNCNLVFIKSNNYELDSLASNVEVCLSAYYLLASLKQALEKKQ